MRQLHTIWKDFTAMMLGLGEEEQPTAAQQIGIGVAMLLFMVAGIWFR